MKEPIIRQKTITNNNNRLTIKNYEGCENEKLINLDKHNKIIICSPVSGNNVRINLHKK